MLAALIIETSHDASVLMRSKRGSNTNGNKQENKNGVETERD